MNDHNFQGKFVAEGSIAERRLRILFDRAPIGILTADAATLDILRINPALCRMLGYSQAELLGKRVIELLPLEEIPKLIKSIDDQLHGEPIVAAAVPCLRKDGSLTYADVNAIALPIEDRQVLVGFFVDAEERKQAEDALRASERRCRELFEKAPMAITSRPLSGKITAVNPAFARLFGYDSPAELLSTVANAADFFADRGRRSEIIRMLVENPQQNTFESLYRRKDGSTFWGQAAINITMDDEGGVVHQGFVTDITDRKAAEAALRESEERYRSLVEDQIELVNCFKPDGTVIFANRRCRVFFGLGQEVIGSKWQPLVHPDDQALIEKALAGLSPQNPIVTIENRAYDAEGALRWLQFSNHAFFNADGTLREIQSVGRDITDRKAAEDERDKIQGQLLQAQKMESVGRLAGGVAHDFNNMLGVILGHTELALSQLAATDPLHGDLTAIRRAAERSADLTRQLLAFARKQTAAPKVLELNQTVEGVLTMLQRLIGEDIELVWRPDPQAGQVKIDPAQLDQILANLCVNARDAIADVGRIIIETGTAAVIAAASATHGAAHPGDYLWIAVSDDGCGMDDTTLASLFEPFFTTKEIGKGTGLGLATVYGIVKQNNGFINVTSTPQKGAAFKIFLPRYLKKTARIAQAAENTTQETGCETILLVEDELAILQMTTTMLERQGFRVLAAATPGESLRIAEAYPGTIDLLMTDVVMPEMNGRDLAKNILRIYPQIKRLFMSGYTAEVIAHHGVLDPGVHFIQKPFTVQSVCAKIREILDSD